ncbi:MAG: formimidoylglutamase [Deltaproteobacteria bacterium]|nr:formimidoylglutamase [Deltaproteobacteria bacterium]
MNRLEPADAALFFKGTSGDPRLGEVARRGLPEGALEASTIALLGIADDRGIVNGGGRAGARLGPQEFRRFFYKLTPGGTADLKGLTICDLGDAGPGPSGEGGAERSIEEVHALAEANVRDAISRGATVVSIGGGHDVAFGSHSGLVTGLPEGARVFGLNVDAHLDLRPLRDGKITSGTPFRRLLERFGPRYKLSEYGIQMQHNAEEHFDYAQEHGVRVHELFTLGTSPIARFAEELEHLTRNAEAIALSLCLDAVEASSAPGVSAPCPDGFSARELYAFARIAGAEPKVRLLDLVELSPPLDVDGRTARLAASAAWHFLGGVATRSFARIEE